MISQNGSASGNTSCSRRTITQAQQATTNRRLIGSMGVVWAGPWIATSGRARIIAPLTRRGPPRGRVPLAGASSAALMHAPRPSRAP